MIHSAHDKLKEISLILLKEIPDQKNPGLLNGKMGVSLFFFHFASETGASEYQEFAEQLIDEVYEEVSKNQLATDFENGLAGIAWGIEHLVQRGFVEAETNQILRDVDDKIYRFITTNNELPAGIRRGVMGYMLYILSRLDCKDPNSEDGTIIIFKRLLTDLINRLGSAVEENVLKIQEPRLFDITWELPLSLVLLGRCYAMNIHTIKIKRILEHLSYDVLSLYPRLLCHRLYLLYGVESVLQQMDLPEWKQHADILKRGTDIDKILDHELKNKNIHFRNGVAGITFISNQYYQITEDTSFLPGKEKLIHKIMSSEYWEWIESKQPKEKNDTGFLNGLTGVAMQLLDLLKEKSEKVKNLQIHVES